MDHKPAVLLIHGYGVRSSFWDLLVEHFQSLDRFGKIQAMSLDVSVLDHGVEQVAEAARQLHGETGSKVILLGHSLGGAYGALAAQKLEPSQLAGLVALSSPYGEKKPTPSLIFWLIKRRLLPGWLVRGSFFSPYTPVPLQKRLFNNASPEKGEVLDQLSWSHWFHQDRVTALPCPTLVIASQGDKLVHWTASRSLAEALEADFILAPPEKAWGHNDWVVLGDASDFVTQTIIDRL